MENAGETDVIPTQSTVMDSQETVVDSQEVAAVGRSPKPDPKWGVLHFKLDGVEVKQFDLVELEHIFGRHASENARVPGFIELPEFTDYNRHISRQHFAVKLIKEMAYVTNRSQKKLFAVNGRKCEFDESHILPDRATIVMASNRIEFLFRRCIGEPAPTKRFPPSITSVYEIGQSLGEGTFGKVYVAYKKSFRAGDDPRVAIKAISKMRYSASMSEAENRNQALSEINILKAVDHVNIVKIVEAMEGDYHYFLILEFLEGKELFLRIETAEARKKYRMNEEKTVKVLFFQMANALAHLHSINIAHRDVKAENVLLKDERPYTVVKLADFGMGRFTRENRMQTRCGTPGYMAPEIVTEKTDSTYTTKVDCWSLGVLLYLLSTGDCPFEDDDKESILKGAYSRGECYRKCTWRGAKDVIAQLLKPNPDLRYDIWDVLSDPWLQDPGVDEILSPLIWNNGPRPEVASLQVPRNLTVYTQVDPHGRRREFPLRNLSLNDNPRELGDDETASPARRPRLELLELLTGTL